MSGVEHDMEDVSSTMMDIGMDMAMDRTRIWTMEMNTMKTNTIG